MKKVLALACVALVAAGAAAFVATRGDSRSDEIAADVERLLQAGDAAGAEALARRERAKLPPGRADYVEALVAFQRGKFEESVDAAEKAYAAAPEDWRAVSILFFACARSGRLSRAYDVVHGYTGSRPRDERGLAAEAQYWIEIRTDAPDPDRALALLDEIAALPERVAKPGDPTAVTKDLLDRLRSGAEELRGRRLATVAAARDRVRAAPGDADAHIQLGEALRKAGDVPGARGSLRTALQLAPGRGDAAEQLVKLLLVEEFTGGPESEEAVALSSRLLADQPQEPRLQILHARSLARFGTTDAERDPAMFKAIDIYRGLLARPDLPIELRQEARRNLAVTLFDFRAGGKAGDYLDEALGLLAEYRAAGGAMDEQAQMVWRDIQREKQGGERK